LANANAQAETFANNPSDLTKLIERLDAFFCHSQDTEQEKRRAITLKSRRLASGNSREMRFLEKQRIEDGHWSDGTTYSKNPRPCRNRRRARLRRASSAAGIGIAGARTRCLNAACIPGCRSLPRSRQNSAANIAIAISALTLLRHSDQGDKRLLPLRKRL
jgi:hypothetical protein